MRISDWSSDVCSSDLSPGLCGRAWRDVRRDERPDPAGHGRTRRHPAARDRRLREDQPPPLGPAGRGGPDRTRIPAGSKLAGHRSEEHTSELQSLMRISYAVFCLKKKKTRIKKNYTTAHDI